MEPSVLHRPVGTLCDSVQPISSQNSLRLAADRFRTEGCPLLAVHDGSGIAGVITESDLAEALATGLHPNAAIEAIPYSQVPQMLANSSGAEALRIFNERGARALLIVDANTNLVGLLTPAHLYPHPMRGMRPRTIGGMATPAGVHLTTGSQSAGQPPHYLVLTGALLFSLFFVSSWLADSFGQAVLRLNVSVPVATYLALFLSPVLFLALLRALPIAGYHAAEHMVVHAIERGEDLDYEIVRRMPRVHPRCGTNLAVAVSMFLSISGLEWHPDEGLRLLVALLATLFFWRPVGEFVQYWFTTRPPNRKQIEAGIRSGKELLKKYQTSPIVHSNGFRRLASSGIPWVILGSTSAGLILDFLFQSLGWGSIVR